jgi:hypothetical protein
MIAVNYVVGNQNINMTSQKFFNKNDLGKIYITLEDKTFKNKEIELKNKLEKVRNFNPKSCYEFSDLNENDLDNTYTPNDSAPSKTPNVDDLSIIRDKPKINLDSQIIANKNITTKRIFLYKKSIKWIDISVCFLIITGCLLAQYENEMFYQENKQDRIGVVKLIKHLKAKNPDINYANFNISYYNNSEIWNKVNLTDYYNIPIFFKISSTGQIIRYCILIFTILCIPLIIISKYIEYKRDCIYKQKLESNFYFILVTFFKTNYFYILIVELIMIMPFQYPGVDNYVIYDELGDTLCLPFSSCLAVLTFIRFYFLLKLFKHLTKWTSTSSEEVW